MKISYVSQDASLILVVAMLVFKDLRIFCLNKIKPAREHFFSHQLNTTKLKSENSQSFYQLTMETKSLQLRIKIS